jgi:hypothetical protein
VIETVTDSAAGLAAAAQLLHDFNLEYDNLEYDEPSPPERLAERLAELIAGHGVTVVLAR